jgi:hypothetical protein
MELTHQIAKQLKDVHFGGNWTAVSLKEKLADVTWQQSIKPVGSFHTIAALVYHMNYYVSATLKVLEGGRLEAKDELSFDHPPIASQQDWERLLQKTWTDVENLALAIEQMPESQLWEVFVDETYGNYYRCIHGPIEHCHYHLGQIALIKSMLAETSTPD